MGLRRLYCIPRALPHGGGAYVNYDFDAMLGIVALESVRNRCMVVGEDLGTVPEGFRDHTAQARVFSCRVLYFERDWDGRFRLPDEYPSDAVASTGTHDLPTLAGWWKAADGTTREQLLDAFVAAGIEVDRNALTAPLVAAYRYLARSCSRLVLLQLEDGIGSLDQVNVPGTVDEEPNWQRKLAVPIDALPAHPIFAAIVRALRDERPREGGAQ
jgi:4-alpha-glucanotransferase